LNRCLLFDCAEVEVRPDSAPGLPPYFFVERKMMKVYVASSWRNEYQQEVVAALREDGHTVYDFKDSEGFRWSEVDPDWQNWTPASYLVGLTHSTADRGYNRDMTALKECEVCVMVMPCGMSASLETGWARGAGKLTLIYVPALREPDLMVKMAHLVTTSLDQIRKTIREFAVGGAASA
jgi:hypothetical protein